MTMKSNKLKNCFRSDLELEDAVNKWYKEIDSILHQCFKKIRITSSPPKRTIEYEIHQALQHIKSLREKYSASNAMQKVVLNIEINSCEKKLAEVQGNRCRNIISEQMMKIRQNGKFSMDDAWKLKKRMFPRCSEAPFAVQDDRGNLISDYPGILDAMKEEFVYRLRNRPINHELNELRELKEYLCQLRLKISKNAPYTEWTLEQLHKAINKLKNNKCKDPLGHINELYKYLGDDGLESLLDMLNYIKKMIMIPSKLNLSNVSTIYKGKGSKQIVTNLRGIFKLPIIRNILDRLICFEEQEPIGVEMGSFQVGNQKGRNIRDHTLIVHSVVKDAKDTKSKVDINFTDIKQCFDSIWLDEATNDLFESGVTSRNLNLLYEGNRKTRMCVETHFGQSDRAELHKVVMQGSVPGGLLCSNQLSKLCNKLHKEGDVYMYKGRVPIPPLAMVDDIASIAKCNSTESLKTSIKTDTFIQRKKLEGQTGEGKCQWVHIGGGTCESCYCVNGEQISKADSYKYLGDHVADLWETLYSKRWEKAQGYSVTCQAMCTEISLGFQTYSFAKMLHRSIFVNGTMVNMETWPEFSTTRIEMFERIEQGFLRRILEAHSKTPIECLYLELGIMPFRFHLMMKRIMYLYIIMQRNDNEITKQIVLCQKESNCKGDFYSQTKENMEYLSISETDLSESITKMKENLDKKTKKKAFQYLIGKATNHSKVNENLYTDCEGLSHYDDTRFTPDLINVLFKFRTRMFLVKNNFRNNYINTNTLCPVCNDEEDTQEHLFECKQVMERCKGNKEFKYQDIFSDNNDTLLGVSLLLKELVDIRNIILNPEETEDN